METFPSLAAFSMTCVHWAFKIHQKKVVYRLMLDTSNFTVVQILLQVFFLVVFLVQIKTQLELKKLLAYENLTTVTGLDAKNVGVAIKFG